MAVFHGKSGQVNWDVGGTEDEIENVKDFTVTIGVDVAEATTMSDTYKTYTVGYTDWTATVTCLLDSAGLNVPIAGAGTSPLGDSASATLELELESSQVTYGILHGTAFCVDISVSQDANDNPTVTYSFQGNGTLTWATSDPSP